MSKVRLASAADAAALAQMNAVFNRVRVPVRSIRAKLGKSGEIVAVATDADGPVAFACAQVHDSFCYPRPWAELTELFVSPTHRRRGLGTRLVRFVERELARRGVAHVHILTEARNRGAQALYRSLGYEHNTRKPEVLFDRNMKPRRAARRGTIGES